MTDILSLPDVLFSKGSENIVPNSTLWLHCIINTVSLTLTLSWTKDGVPVIINTIHIRTRKTESATLGSTTLTLIIDNFGAFDDGRYQCFAENNGEIVNGTALNLTGTL